MRKLWDAVTDYDPWTIILWVGALGFAFCLLMATLEATKDRGACLAREPYTYLHLIQTGSIPMGNGQTMPVYTYVPIETTQCVRWEYPEGRPHG